MKSVAPSAHSSSSESVDESRSDSHDDDSDENDDSGKTDGNDQADSDAEADGATEAGSDDEADEDNETNSNERVPAEVPHEGVGGYSGVPAALLSHESAGNDRYGTAPAAPGPSSWHAPRRSTPPNIRRLRQDNQQAQQRALAERAELRAEAVEVQQEADFQRTRRRASAQRAQERTLDEQAQAKAAENQAWYEGAADRARQRAAAQQARQEVLARDNVQHVGPRPGKASMRARSPSTTAPRPLRSDVPLERPTPRKRSPQQSTTASLRAAALNMMNHVSTPQQSSYPPEQHHRSPGDRQTPQRPSYGPVVQDTRHGAADAYYDQNQSFSTNIRPGRMRPTHGNPPLRYGYHAVERPPGPYPSRPPDQDVPQPPMANTSRPTSDKPTESHNPFDHSIKPGLIGTLKGLRGLILKRPEVTEDTPERYELLRRTDKFFNSKIVRYTGVLRGMDVAMLRREIEEVAQTLQKTSAKPEDSGGKIGVAEAGTFMHTGQTDCPCSHVLRNCKRSGHPSKPHICKRKHGGGSG